MFNLQLKKRFAKWLTGFDADSIKAHNTVLTVSMGLNNSGLNDTYLFDFWGNQFNGGGSGVGTRLVHPVNDPFMGTETVPTDATGNPASTPDNKPIGKLKVKPIDVLQELETVPTPFTLVLLEEKIGILKDKEKLITQVYAKREITALIERLENRKKYPEHKDFFERYQNTTDEKIDVLLSKYELVMKTSDIFVPEFPDEAIKAMTEYSEKMALICNKKPVFYVIATEDKFKKAYEKRDPILLVQSPFGFFWQCLGAWDKEMILLFEL